MSQSKLKIAFLLPINGLTGGVFVVYAHAQALRASGHDVTIVFEAFKEEWGFGHHAGFDVPYRMLDRLPEGERFDVAIATWWKTFFSLPRVGADRYLYFVQGDERRFYPEDDVVSRSWVECTYRFPEVGIITIARWLQKMLRDEFGVAAGYAPNGVDGRRFSPDVEPLAPRGETFRVLIEGPGGTAFKRVEDAFQITGSFEGIEVWYVSSDGVRLPHWRCDRFFPEVPHEKMAAIYRSCDVLLKTSAVEGFGMPPLEMMATGGACIVSGAEGFSEYVLDGENALVMPTGDIETGRRHLSRLRSDREFRAALSRRGLETARAMDWSVQHPRFEQAVLGMHGARSPRPLRELIQTLGKIERAVAARTDAMQGRLSAKIADRLTARFPRPMSSLRSTIWGLQRLGKSLRK